MQKGLNPGVCPEEVVSLCAAYSAQEFGDARGAIKLLETAAEIAVEKKKNKILLEYVTTARDLIRFESILSVISTLPIQIKATALACLRDHKSCEKQNTQRPRAPITGTVYVEYVKICNTIGIESLTMRRVADFIDELETLGLYR